MHASSESRARPNAGPPASSPDERPPNDFRAYAFLTTTSLCWATNVVLSRVAVGEVSPFALVTLRWIVVLSVLGVFAHRQIREDLPLLRKQWIYLAAMGAFGYSVFNGMLYTAAHHTSAVNIGILQGSLPVFVLVVAYLAFRTPTRNLQIVGVSVTLIGVLIVAANGSVERLLALSFGLGDVLMIVACSGFAVYTVALRWRPAVSALGMFAALALAAFAASIPMLATELWLGHTQWPTQRGWLLVSASALIPSITGQICFMQGVQLIGPKRAGVFINLVPVFAAVLAVVFLSEAFEIYHAVALALVLGGLWLSERGEDLE